MKPKRAARSSRWHQAAHARSEKGGAKRHLSGCGGELLEVQEYEVIPAGAWRLAGYAFQPIAGDEGDQVHPEYRCVQCGGLLDLKESRWFLGQRQEEAE